MTIAISALTITKEDWFVTAAFNAGVHGSAAGGRNCAHGKVCVRRNGIIRGNWSHFAELLFVPRLGAGKGIYFPCSIPSLPSAMRELI